jgi:hypothetical protein
MKHVKSYEIFESMLSEDTSATGGPAGAVAGGAVSSTGISNSQPSSAPGVTTNPTYAATGGIDGSGDVSHVLGTSDKQMGTNHGAMTGKKSRTPKISMKSLKDIFSKRQDYTSGQSNVDRKPKVMDFDAFQKADLTQVKRQDQ